MTRILVLTKNVLTELELQAQLQQLNYEVFVSSSIYTQLCYQMPITHEIQGFQLIMFSETLTDDEIKQAMPVLLESERPLVQRVDDEGVEDDEAASFREENGLIPCSRALSLRECRQFLEDLIKHEVSSFLEKESYRSENRTLGGQRALPLLQHVSLTKIEHEILDVLYAAHGKLVTKEVLCDEVWGQSLTKSRQVQIYTCVGRLKDKLQALKPNILFIGTQRSIGYFLTPAFFEHFEMDLPIYQSTVKKGIQESVVSL